MAAMSDFRSKYRSERKYVNVDLRSIPKVQKIISDYNKTLESDEFFAEISTPQEQENGKCSFKIIGKCVPQYNGLNFRLIARSFTPYINSN